MISGGIICIRHPAHRRDNLRLVDDFWLAPTAWNPQGRGVQEEPAEGFALLNFWRVRVAREPRRVASSMTSQRIGFQGLGAVLGEETLAWFMPPPYVFLSHRLGSVSKSGSQPIAWLPANRLLQNGTITIRSSMPGLIIPYKCAQGLL